jgi:hypothetical protein
MGNNFQLVIFAWVKSNRNNTDNCLFVCENQTKNFENYYDKIKVVEKVLMTCSMKIWGIGCYLNNCRIDPRFSILTLKTISDHFLQEPIRIPAGNKKKIVSYLKLIKTFGTNSFCEELPVSS